MYYPKYICGMIITLLAFALGNIANAANIAVFTNLTQVEQPETTNLIAALTAQGHTVIPFTGLTAANIVNATNVSNTLVIPELSVGSTVFTDLASAQAISNFTNAGGSLVVTGADLLQAVSILNNAFGFTITRVPNSFIPPGTVLTGAIPLTATNGTYPVNLASLPPGAFNLFTNGADAAAFSVNIGAGQVTYIGYNWVSGFLNNAWINVLAPAVVPRVAVVVQVQPPTSIPTLSHFVLLILVLSILFIGHRKGI